MQLLSMRIINPYIQPRFLTPIYLKLKVQQQLTSPIFNDQQNVDYRSSASAFFHYSSLQRAITLYKSAFDKINRAVQTISFHGAGTAFCIPIYLFLATINRTFSVGDARKIIFVVMFPTY